MVNRILSIVGWIGTGLVLVAVAIRFGYPAKEQWAYYLAWAGLVCVLAYSLAVARSRQGVSRRQARYGTLAGDQRPGGPRHPDRDQLHRRASRTSAGT